MTSQEKQNLIDHARWIAETFRYSKDSAMMTAKVAEIALSALCGEQPTKCSRCNGEGFHVDEMGMIACQSCKTIGEREAS